MVTLGVGENWGSNGKAKPGWNLYLYRPILLAMSLPRCFLNMFVYSEKETLRTDPFDALNYHHADKGQSSHPSTDKFNCASTHVAC